MNDLDWLTERRPEPELDPETTARARAALLAHAGETRRAGRAGEAPPRRRAPARRRRKSGALVLAAVAVVAVVVAFSGGDGPTRLGAPEAVAAPLVRLSHRIQAEPKPSGDATLVLRKHTFPDAEGFTGADLYLDDGHYYYAPTRAELSAGDDTGGDSVKREVAAAEAAVGLSPAQARERMIAATMAPGPPATQAPPAAADELSAEAKRQIAHKNKTGRASKPASPRTIDDNRIWIGSMDALIAGAGRAEVRAGVMELLATIPAVKVQEGEKTWALRNTDYPDGYEETLTVDARTGVIVSMIGGVAGKPPSVVVDYDIKRVEARDVIG